MEKYALYPGREPDGTPRCHLIEPGSAYGIGSTSGLEKTASGEHLPEVIELIEALAPQPDRLYIVNSALGAGEYVGFNLRGDWFNRSGLLHTPPGWDDIPVSDIKARRQAANRTEHVPGWGDLAWGFPTFYNAHRFRHHVNKDPNKAYGFILGAFWDPRMHRVILVSELIRENCCRLGAQSLYDRIAGGEFPDTSMGAKVPFDVCSICGNTAKNPANYCKHVHKNAMPPYGMKEILPDGRRCGVYNPYPRFFDDSFVFIGAERSAKAMTNVTALMKGETPYDQTIFPFRPPMQKAASYGFGAGYGSGQAQGTGYGYDSGQTPRNEKKQLEINIASAADRVFSAPEPDNTFEEKMSRLLSGMPLSDKRDRRALQFLSDKRKAHKRVLSRDLSGQEAEKWEALERRQLKSQGISPADVEEVRKRMIAEEEEVVKNEKSASTKWAEMLKRIPAPLPHQLSAIREHEARLPSLGKKVLDYLSEDPGSRLRAAARLGVILRPEEFQYSMLKGMHPEHADECHRCGHVFRPTPLSLNMRPSYNAGHPIPSGLTRTLEKVLGSLLGQRSFAPAAVRIRIVRRVPHPEHTPLMPHADPLLDKVSSLYNEYRAGLLAHPPDWRYVPVGFPPLGDLDEEVKLAESSQEMSQQLLHLAYWPALPLG